MIILDSTLHNQDVKTFKILANEHSDYSDPSWKLSLLRFYFQTTISRFCSHHSTKHQGMALLRETTMFVLHGCLLIMQRTCHHQIQTDMPPMPDQQWNSLN